MVGLELLLGQVGEGVDGPGVGGSLGVVELDLLHIGFENVESLNFFINAVVLLLVLLFEVIELLNSALPGLAYCHKSKYCQEHLHAGGLQ